MQMIVVVVADTDKKSANKQIGQCLCEYYSSLLDKQRALDDDMYNPKKDTEESDIMLTQFNDRLRDEEEWARLGRPIKVLVGSKTQVYNLSTYDYSYMGKDVVLFPPMRVEKMPSILKNMLKNTGGK